MKEDLVRALNIEAEALARSLDRGPVLPALLDGSIERDAYVCFLTQTFHYVRWTTPFLTRSAERLASFGGHGRICGLLTEKAREESGHEEWALADLAALSMNEAQVLASAPTRAVTAYVEWNRFHATIGSPVGILGTAYVLEHVSAGGAGDVAGRLARSERIPDIKRAVRFLRGHGASDESHLAELCRALREIRAPADQDAIRLSAATTRALYAHFFTPPPPDEDEGGKSPDSPDWPPSRGRRASGKRHAS